MDEWLMYDQAHLRCIFAERDHDQPRHECDIELAVVNRQHGWYRYME